MEVTQALICIWEMGMLFYAAFQLLPQRRMHVITKIIWWICVALDTGLLIYQRHMFMYSRIYLLFAILVNLILIEWRFEVSLVDCVWGIATYFETIYILDLFIVLLCITVLKCDEQFIYIIFHQVVIARICIFIVSRTLICIGIVLFLGRKRFFLGIYQESRKFLLAVPFLQHLTLFECDKFFMAGKQKIGSRNFIFFLIIYLFLFVIFMSYYGYQQKRNQIELLKEKNKVMQQEYRNIVSWSRKRSSLIHDAKNHLIALEGILSSGETDRALQYVTQLLNKEDEREQIAYTDDAVLNSLLNEKISWAKTLGIDIKICIDDLNDPFVTDVDVCVLLSNLLDNAVEAAGKAHGKRSIVASLKEFTWGNMVQVENSCMEPSKETTDRPQTTKKNKREHGIGLQNVESVVEKYRGTIKYERREESFCVTIMLYR